MRQSTRLILAAIFSLAVIAPGAIGNAEVKLAGLFGDSMVLQRDVAAPVWGWAEPGEQVSVSVPGQTKITTADRDGKWLVRLDALSAGGPLVLTVEGSNKIEIKDVLVGEVWLCSGQSNMAMTVSRSLDFEKEKAQADYPQIRMFKTEAHATPQPQDDCQGQWAVCSSETVGAFSAAGYFFGRKLHQELNVPIGLINSSWGGTDVAAWTSLPAQRKVDAIAVKLKQYDATIANYDPEKAQLKYQAALKKWKEDVALAKKSNARQPRRPRSPINPVTSQNRPANLFNGMINPLVPYALRGAIWYQGERNASTVPNGILYADQLKALITDWRQRWGGGDFPFITVQLPNFRAAQKHPVETTGWVMVRESQLRSLSLPNAGLAITTDVGEVSDIHPKNKQAVGHRLALWALGTTYEKEIVYSGPIFSFCQYRVGTVQKNGRSRPGRMMVGFLHGGAGLKASDDKPLRGFAIAGADRKFYPANASVSEDGMITLISPKVIDPVAARYNWAENPNGNLVNSARLPASPFRTDMWDVTKE